MYSIYFLCEELLKFLKLSGFKDSTIYRYKTGLEIFKSYYKERNVEFYNSEIGNDYANDLYSPKTHKISNARKKFRSKVIQHFNHYLANGNFILNYPKRKRFDDERLSNLDLEYQKFKNFINERYTNLNTRKFYIYEIYIFLKFLLISKNIDNLNSVTPVDVYDYLKTVKDNMQKAALCVLKFYFTHISRTDLYNSISGNHAIKKKKLIPYLTKEETERIWDVLNSDTISYKNKSLFLLAFTLGIRACDIVNLKLTDINWDQEYISFTQRKTGNTVNLPLSPVLGNALFNYITLERKKSSYNNIYISSFPPFKPLTGHSACYSIVRKIINKANIDMNERFNGVHFLRHNVASTMVNSEVPIETIAAVLGHASPDSTGIYITTNKDKLKDCMLSFKLLGGE